MKFNRSNLMLGAGVIVSLIGVHALITTDGNLGGGGALVIGVIVIGCWAAGWFK